MNEPITTTSIAHVQHNIFAQKHAYYKSDTSGGQSGGKHYVWNLFTFRDFKASCDNLKSKKIKIWHTHTQTLILFRRRTRVWALAPKPESVDASFRFSHDGGVSSHEATTKNQFCFLSLIRCLVKFVVLESHLQSLWVLNQYHITINTHLLSHIATFCLSL